MTLLDRLIDRIGRWVLGIATEEVARGPLHGSGMLPDLSEEKPMPLPHKDSERQAAASRGPFTLTPREDAIIDEHLGSPRAITRRYAIPPPPRKPRI